MIPLFILPFDHRGSFALDLLDVTFPVHGKNKKILEECKMMIYEAVLEAKSTYRGSGALGVLVDEELGSAVIRRAKKDGIPLSLTTEASGHDVFRFVHGAAFGVVLNKIHPTWAKALAYYTVGDEKKNKATRKKLRQLSDFCEKEGIDFMLEVLVGEEKGKGKEESVSAMIREMQNDGIAPSIWKLEGLEKARDWDVVAKTANAPLIVLGRGESQKQVDAWVKSAAQSGRVMGFAIGRTVFLKPLQQYIAGTLTKKSTITTIAKNYVHAIKVWEDA